MHVITTPVFLLAGLFTVVRQYRCNTALGCTPQYLLLITGLGVIRTAWISEAAGQPTYYLDIHDATLEIPYVKRQEETIAQRIGTFC